MDPNNNQPIANQTPVSQAPSVPPVAPAPAPEQTGAPAPKTQKRYVLYGALLGLAVVVIVGVAAFYLMFAPGKSQNVAVAPSPVPTVATEQEVVVNDASDLEGLLVGLAQADDTLDKELTSLTKDSDF